MLQRTLKLGGENRALKLTNWHSGVVRYGNICSRYLHCTPQFSAGRYDRISQINFFVHVAFRDLARQTTELNWTELKWGGTRDRSERVLAIGRVTFPSAPVIPALPLKDCRTVNEHRNALPKRTIQCLLGFAILNEKQLN